MRRNLLFTRWVAVALAIALVRSSTALAITAVPGSLAVLEPPVASPVMRAAWDEIKSEIYLDPLLLIKALEEVARELEDWSLASASIRSSYQTADRITLDRTRALVDQAWTHYYRFEYDQAAGTLKEAKGLLSAPGDSGFRTRLMFEVLMLSGITARAAGEKAYAEHLKLAAALAPDRLLSSERYSPETISIYDRLKREVLREEQVFLHLEGKPADAKVEVDGTSLPSASWSGGYKVLPGKHFLEILAPGYEPWGQVLEVQRFEPANIKFELVPSGPEGDPHTFFLQRLEEGDVSYLVLLAQRLKVDYVLVPDPQEDQLQVWLIDSTGRTVDHAVVWEMGSPPESGAERVSDLLSPLRQELDRNRTLAGAPFSLPARQHGPPGETDADNASPAWKSYAVVIGIVLLLGAVSANSSSGARIEATW